MIPLVVRNGVHFYAVDCYGGSPEFNGSRDCVVRRHKASSPQDSPSNGCCFFRYCLGPINVRLSFPTPTVGVKWACVIQELVVALLRVLLYNSYTCYGTWYLFVRRTCFPTPKLRCALAANKYAETNSHRFMPDELNLIASSEPGC